MKKRFALMLTAVAAFAALSIRAKAQASDQLVVKVPYEFVVSGKTLPAGTYRLNRADNFAPRKLVLRNSENSAVVLVIPSQVQNAVQTATDADARHGLGFNFQEIGGEHFLTRIETADYIFTVPVSKSDILEASNKSHKGSMSSGTSGN